MVDGARRVEFRCHGLRESPLLPDREERTGRPLLFGRVEQPVHPVRILIAAVAQRVVVHGVQDCRRTILHLPHQIVCQGAVAGRRFRIVQLHAEVADVGKAERVQRSALVGGVEHPPQITDLAGGESVVAGDEEVEAELLHPVHRP